MPIQVTSQVVTDDVFWKHLACYTSQADRTVIFCLAGGALLENGETNTILQADDSASVSSDWVNMAYAKVEEIFGMRQDTWSGPVALLGFIPVSNFSTPWALISSLSIDG